MIYACCDEKRKTAVLGNPALNGIDFLEVLDREETVESLRQRTLLVYCLKPAPTNLTPSNVLIEGGESIVGIAVQWIAPASAPPASATADEKAIFSALPAPANVLVVRTDKAGDFSPYTLRLVNDASQAAEDSFAVTETLAGFDPQLAEIGFSFKVECGPDFDCAPTTDCPPESLTPPPINYLAKDYGSFRTLLLDRLQQLLPSWQGGSEADIGVVLAELIAYVGDQLSYQQDAVATEAYLSTARSRISLRRHALLVDYRISEGCNARAFVSVQVSLPMLLDRAVTRFYTFAAGMPTSLAVGSGNETAALDAGVIAFEPLGDAHLFPEHNEMHFYAWGDADCCLPQGATQATLLGSYPNLQIGDILIFVEALGPQTGFPADADIRHRCAVRLTAVAITDGQGRPLVDPLFESGTGAPIGSAAQLPTPVTQIQWSQDDALPFPVCISSTFVDGTGAKQSIADVSIVVGNVVLADQGLSMPAVALPPVPAPTLSKPSSGDRCDPQSPVSFPPFFRPRLPTAPLTQAVPLPLVGAPVTPAPVPLSATGYVSLMDSNGFVSLMPKATAPSAWPGAFGVVATPNGALLDLAVVFDPQPLGPAGLSGPVTLERFTGLSLSGGPPNGALTRINGVSRFITVSSPTGSPTTFLANPTMLNDVGATPLQDSNGVTYLTAEPVNPFSWPPLFAVMAQGDIQQPSQFKLLVLYQPPTGAVGVTLPIVVEQMPNLDFDNAQATVAAASALVRILTFEAAANPSLSAFDLMNNEASQAQPAIALSSVSNSVRQTWTPLPDLLASGAEDRNFVAEIDSDGFAKLRFGDGVNGLSPDAGTIFTATFRVGNGASGNVGADSLTFFAGDPRILSCANPMAAAGGADPETAAQIRRRAPVAFETQERAVTMTDYANAVEGASSQVAGAAATLRWTGSWYTAFVAAEPKGGGELRKPLRKTISALLERYRLAGQDFKLESPDYVPLDIVLDICVEDGFFQRDVEAAVASRLTLGDPLSGKAALFAPGSFALGETVYLSPITTAVRTVAGVCSVSASVFQPQGVETRSYLHRGEIPIGAFQAARLDNDRSFPNHGQLRLVMAGGK
jgi:hypothetical protein